MTKIRSRIWAFAVPNVPSGYGRRQCTQPADAGKYAGELDRDDCEWRGQRYALKLKQESPSLFVSEDLLGHALLLLGRTNEAALIFAEMQSESGEALLAARSGNRNRALVKLAELRQRDGDKANFPYALIHAQLGDREAAFAALERAWQVRDTGLLDIKVNAYLDPLRSDPRYVKLVNKVGFPV